MQSSVARKPTNNKHTSIPLSSKAFGQYALWGTDKLLCLLHRGGNAQFTSTSLEYGGHMRDALSIEIMEVSAGDDIDIQKL